MGRVWESPTGNLFASTIVRLRANDPPASTLAFVAGLAVYDAVQHIAPALAFRSNGPTTCFQAMAPNCAGCCLNAPGMRWLSGIGLNLISHPEGLDRPVTDLEGARRIAAAPASCREILANAFAIWLDRWRMGGLTGCRQSWQKVAHPVGTALTANLPDGAAEQGLYAGLSDDGALQLRLADGHIRVIHAGDVFLV